MRITAASPDAPPPPPPVPPAPPRRATRDDAPVPEEHIEQDNGDGVRFHSLWIPWRTGPDRYLSGNSSLNLGGDPAIGDTSDWHKSTWQCPVTSTSWRHHYANTNHDRLDPERARLLADWLGEEELADARKALRELPTPHPAGLRAHKVYCATHVRAIIEEALDALQAAARNQNPNFLLLVQDPYSTTSWLASDREWHRLHDLAKRIRDQLLTDPYEQAIWENWRRYQCPDAGIRKPRKIWHDD